MSVLFCFREPRAAALQEYFSVDRNEGLRRANFPGFDVWKMPERPSAILAAHIWQAREFFRSRYWTNDLPSLPEDAAALLRSERPTIGIFDNLNTTIESMLDVLPKAKQQDLLHIHPDLTDAQLAYYLAACGAIVLACQSSETRDEQVKSMCTAMGVPIYSLTDRNPNTPLAEIIASIRPVNAIDWIARLRKALEHVASRAVYAEARLEHAEAELTQRSIRLAAAEADLASRSYRLALKVRGVANSVRKIAKRLRVP